MNPSGFRPFRVTSQGPFSIGQNESVPGSSPVWKKWLIFANAQALLGPIDVCYHSH